MIHIAVLAILAALILGIVLKSVVQATLWLAFVVGAFLLSCYAFDVSPRTLLMDGAHFARHEVKLHKRVVREWL